MLQQLLHTVQVVPVGLAQQQGGETVARQRYGCREQRLHHVMCVMLRGVVRHLVIVGVGAVGE
jgi:hypothetical protein